MRVLLFLSSLACAVLMILHAVRENLTAEWRGHQQDYVRQLRALDANDDADAFRIELRQVVLGVGGITDRCITCHVAVEDPRMKDQPQPIRTHPGNYLETHEVDRFGCTLCHDVQGAAVTQVDAKSYKREQFWEKPVLPSPFVEANCYRCHGAPLEQTSTYQRGHQLFHSKGCMGCHKVNGRGGYLGPDLTKISDASRHVKVPTHEHKNLVERFKNNENIAYLYEAVRYPHAQPQGSLMPDLEFTDQETIALAVYLKSLAKPPALVSLAPRSRPQRPPSDPVERGVGLYTTYCIGCHGKAGVGGIKNPNYVKDTFPALNQMAERLFLYEEEEAEMLVAFFRRGGRNVLTDAAPPDLPDLGDIQAQLEAVRDVIRKGNPAAPMDDNASDPIAMPSWRESLEDEEIDALISYLLMQMPWDELDE